MQAAFILAAVSLWTTTLAHAQLTPDRTYYGINRAVPMTVKVPTRAATTPSPRLPEPSTPPTTQPQPSTDASEGNPASPTTAKGKEPPPAAGDTSAPAAEPARPAAQDPVEAVIELFTCEGPTPVSSAPVIEGKVDMAALFPELWAMRPPRLLYAQLRVGSAHVGSPVVLQPMVTPPMATLLNTQTRQAWFTDPATGTPNYDARKQCELLFNTPASNYSGLRAYTEQDVVFDTSEGEIEFRMRPDHAPNTVCNLLELVRGGFFTDTIVHRIVPRLPTTGHPFVIQFGDPTGTGDGGPGYNIDLENSHLPHDFGVLSMARDDAPDTNGSQVFICLSREGTARLDGKYTSFAQAVRGADVIMKLAAAKTDEKTQRPLNPPRIMGARLLPAPSIMDRRPAVLRPGAEGR